MRLEAQTADQKRSAATSARKLGRQLVKAAADAVLPSSVLIVRGPIKKRRIALTFDDGPAELTREYLDVLAAFDAKATFFVVGEACAMRPRDLEEIAERGHELGGHGYTHSSFAQLGKNELEAELERTAALLPKIPGRSLVRPPRGVISAPALLNCARSGFTVVLWSRDSGDWRLTCAAEILEEFEREPFDPGDIVLLHEGQRRTLDALPALLERLNESGHELVTVSELLDG